MIIKYGCTVFGCGPTDSVMYGSGWGGYDDGDGTGDGYGSDGDGSGQPAENRHHPHSNYVSRLWESP